MDGPGKDQQETPQVGQGLEEDERQGDLLDTAGDDDFPQQEDAPATDLPAQEDPVTNGSPDFLDTEGTSNMPAEEPAEEADIPSGEVEIDDDDHPEERDLDYEEEEEPDAIPFGDEGDFGYKDEDEDDVEYFDDEGLDDGDGQDVPLTDADDGTGKPKRRRRRIIKSWRKSTKKEKREPSKAEKRRRRRAFCILFCCCCLLILILILLLVFLVFNKDDGTKPAPNDDDQVNFVDDFFGFGDNLVPDNVQTTPFDPYVKGDCDFSDNYQPHVISQCQCDGKVTIVADDIRELYDLLRDKLMPELYSPEMGSWNEPITSCSARNQALLWLSSGDTRRAGDLVQRFITATAYVAMNGTKWDYQNLWLSDQNECLWLGLQCNSRFQIHSLALDTINIFGKVHFFLVRLCFGFIMRVVVAHRHITIFILVDSN